MRRKIALLMIFSGISGIMISPGSFFIRDACCRLENPVVSVHPLNPFQAYVDLPVVVNAEIVTSTTWPCEPVNDMLAGLTLPAEAYVVSGDNPAYLGSMNSVDSRDVSWTVIFTQAGTFALDVNASGYYSYSGYVYAHTSMNIEVSEREKHDVAAWLETSLFFEIGESTLLNATVYNLGLKDESHVELQLLINDNVANSTIITGLLAGSFYTMHHTWTPIQPTKPSWRAC